MTGTGSSSFSRWRAPAIPPLFGGAHLRRSARAAARALRQATMSLASSDSLDQCAARASCGAVAAAYCRTREAPHSGASNGTDAGRGRPFRIVAHGEVCFDYGKRLLRLHDDMLDELGRNNPNDAIRIGMSSEFVPFWRGGSMSCERMPRLPRHSRSSSIARKRFRPPFVKTRLISLSSSGPARASRAGSNNGGVSCAGSARPPKMNTTGGRCRSFSRRKAGRFMRRRLARFAPRNGNSKSSAQVQILQCSQPPRLRGWASRQ